MMTFKIGCKSSKSWWMKEYWTKDLHIIVVAGKSHDIEGFLSIFVEAETSLISFDIFIKH